MATQPWYWESKRWTVLASLVVLAGLYAVMWYLMGGCEPTLPGPTDSPRPAGAPSDPGLDVIEAMADANVVELALHAAWFHACRGRLPANLEELGKSDRPTGWPPTPAATADGQTIAYRPTGERTYELALAGVDRAAGTPDDLLLAMTVPDNMPTRLAPVALRTWWDLEYARGMMERLRTSLNQLAPTGN
ncbi:MAG TPA: hypothetical protein VM238_03210 [Phycisphaerae bacterium]|nr:hypothetical protein [Phycisphaerae bacterium]